MLQYSELTVVNNSAGIPTALGYPVNSFMLQNNRPLFVGGGKRERKNGTSNEDEFNMDLAVPAGLVCMTETICTKANAMDANAMDANAMDATDAYAMDTIENDENEVIPDGLYERLMELAETKQSKKLTKRKPLKPKNKTKKVIKKTKSKR
jgi:hypothetical protein